MTVMKCRGVLLDEVTSPDIAIDGQSLINDSCEIGETAFVSGAVIR